MTASMQLVFGDDDDDDNADEADADDCDDCDDNLQAAGTQWWLEEVCTGALASRTEAFASSGLPTTPAEDLVWSEVFVEASTHMKLIEKWVLPIIKIIL